MTASWPPPGTHPYSYAAAAGGQSYTAVNARTTLARPPVMEPPKTASPAPKIEWPQPVREYVSKAFMANNLIAGIDTVTMSTKLKQLITEAAEKDLLGDIDWANYPLPQEIIRRERLGAGSATVAGSKRKSMEIEAVSSEPTLPPWRQKTASLADRISAKDTTVDADHLEKRQKKVKEFRANAPPSKLFDLEKRKQRFEKEKVGAISPYASSRDDSPVPTANVGPIVGTNEKLLKSYFRLTAPPKPETVRPLHILRQTLDLLIKKWREEHNYSFICDQFKSLRQDLTVQHIKNDFLVRVYEAHARLALESGDKGEYNQCQTQLRALYKQNFGGHPGEFMAYRILYFLYTCNRTGMNDILADLTTADKQHPAVRHALNVRSALAMGNYHKFFRLYDDTPNMGGYLLDAFVDRERISALTSICRTYKPDVKISFLTEELAFTDDQQCAQFIFDAGGEHLIEQGPDGNKFLSGKAGAIFETAKQKSARVDIKGQI